MSISSKEDVQQLKRSECVLKSDISPDAQKKLDVNETVGPFFGD